MWCQSRGILLEKDTAAYRGTKGRLAIVKNHSCFILTTARPIEALQRPN